MEPKKKKKSSDQSVAAAYRITVNVQSLSFFFEHLKIRY